MMKFSEILFLDSFSINVLPALQNNPLVSLAGMLSFFGVIFFTLYLVIPTLYVWFYINLANNRISILPNFSNPISRTDKNKFLATMKELGFIEKNALSYAAYLVQGPEETVPPETLKNMRIIRKASQNKGGEAIVISPVYAKLSAEEFFNRENLVVENLMLGFFHILARIIASMGVICIFLSIMSYASLDTPHETPLISALYPGLWAFLLCLISSLYISGFVHSIELILSQMVNILAKRINGLFGQSNWQQDIHILKQQVMSNSDKENLETVLQNCLDKPMKEIAKAVKALAEEQESKLDKILSDTLSYFISNIDKNLSMDMKSVNQVLKDTANSADQMKKQLIDSGTLFSKHMDKQAGSIAKHLTEMQKILNNSEKASQQATEKLISSFATEVDKTYGQLAKFMETSLKNLADKQTIIEKAESNKDSILRDLHNSAKDLGTISNASGKLLEKFTALSKELDGILSLAQKNTNVPDTAKRDKLKMAVMELKKNNNDKLGKLPDM